MGLEKAQGEAWRKTNAMASPSARNHAEGPENRFGCLSCAYYKFVGLSTCCCRVGNVRRLRTPISNCPGFFDREEKGALPMPMLPREDLKYYAQRPADDGCRIAPDGSSITCFSCGMTSHNCNDVQFRYCAACKKFHQ